MARDAAQLLKARAALADSLLESLDAGGIRACLEQLDSGAVGRHPLDELSTILGDLGLEVTARPGPKRNGKARPSEVLVFKDIQGFLV